jgi:hypothetical protein
MKRTATVNDVLKVLRQNSTDLMEMLDVSPVQLSMPTDGKGARIKISVQPGQKHNLPEEIDFTINRDTIKIPLEVQEDYQEYQLH